jgi:signal transduction histidine kinase
MPQIINSPLELVVDPPLSRRSVLGVCLAGFGMVVGLVLLAAYLGHRGSDAIQDTAQTLVREQLLNSERGSALEARIVKESEELRTQLQWVLILCFLLAAGTAGLSIWVIDRAFAKLSWQSAELAHVSWHMLESHEKVARRFSHEMHDELGQSLSGLRGMLSRVNEADFRAIRQECVGIVDEVLQTVRKLSQALRPVILDDFGLDSGLRWLCERFTHRTRIAVDYRSNYNLRLTEALETHLFRITQEALTNIARHSGATKASVEFHVEKGKVQLCISDNGRGLTVETEDKGISLGMVGMRARARQVDGELTVDNLKEGGLRIRVEAPLQQAETNVEQEDSSFIS